MKLITAVFFLLIVATSYGQQPDIFNAKDLFQRHYDSIVKKHQGEEALDYFRSLNFNPATSQYRYQTLKDVITAGKMPVLGVPETSHGKMPAQIETEATVGKIPDMMPRAKILITPDNNTPSSIMKFRD